MQALLDLFRAERTIYLPGTAGESLALAAALAADPDRLRGVHLVSCLLPGVNSFDYAALDPSVSITTFLLPQALRRSFEAGRVRILPLAYTGIADYLAGRLKIDVAIAHVAPADADGLCSLGIAADFTPLAWAAAKTRALIINAAMPVMQRGPRVALRDASVVVHVDGPVVTVKTGRDDPILDAIGASVARLIPDGAAIQIGLGGAPEAVWPHLKGHRNLTLASGLVADGVMALAESGALPPGGRHRAGVALGGASLHRFLATEDLITFATVPETHGVAALAVTPRFTAVNSALEVDLFGQVNLEWHSGRLVSGVGGAPDFAQGARHSTGGRSIIALPSTAGNGAISRIVPRLDVPAVSLSRTDIDTVITEHGVAELRGRSLDERADSLIGAAAPQWRERLAARWLSMRQSL
jgi:acyl-CoA hydrolase